MAKGTKASNPSARNPDMGAEMTGTASVAGRKVSRSGRMRKTRRDVNDNTAQASNIPSNGRR